MTLLVSLEGKSWDWEWEQGGGYGVLEIDCDNYMWVGESANAGHMLLGVVMNGQQAQARIDSAQMRELAGWLVRWADVADSASQ